MTGTEVDTLIVRMERLETRMSALETARVQDVANAPTMVVGIIHQEMPALVKDAVRSVINEERIVADAQRFRNLIGVGRKVAIAVLITVAGALAMAALNGWFLA